ncbi:hypothetical protein D9M70_532770 [compost metagenome]
MFGLQIALVERLDFALEATQVEEQPLLVGGRAHFHQRPRAQDIFLDRRLDPPHRVGGKAEAAIGFELLDGLHQADIAFGYDFADRQAVAAIAHRDLGDEAKVAGDQLVRCFAVVMLLVPLGEHVLFLRFQHRKLADFVEIAIEAAFSSGNGRQIVSGHMKHPPLSSPASGRQAGHVGLRQDPTSLENKYGESMIQGVRFHQSVTPGDRNVTNKD